jgi:ribose transport system ATP-binding protein
MNAATAAFFRDSWQLDINPRRLIRDLSLAERKLVQIARALIDGAAKLVVFDEPTAPLEAQEASLVSSAILRLRQQGIAILYISHYLNEIAALCDRGTVLRNGEVVGYPDRALLQNTDALIKMMVGRDIEQLYTPRQSSAHQVDAAVPVLSVRQLSDGAQLNAITFDIQPGEIVGVAGLLGAGRDVLVDLLYGLRRARSGTISIDGQPKRLRTPYQATRAGMALVPRDRRHQGLILPFSTADNINLASLPQTATFGWEHRGRALEKARSWIDQLSIRPGRPELPVRFMSGGNQQKPFWPAGWVPTHGSLFSMNPLSGSISAPAAIFISAPASWRIADARTGLLQRRAGAAGPLRPHPGDVARRAGGQSSDPGLTLDALLATINGGQEQQV